LKVIELFLKFTSFLKGGWILLLGFHVKFQLSDTEKQYVKIKPENIVILL